MYEIRDNNQLKIKDMTTIIDYTNKRLNEWYENVKLDYGVIGSAVATNNNGNVEIRYEENGIKGLFEIKYPKEDSNISYSFDVWSGMANLENDLIK